MLILFIHNHYARPSGEEDAVKKIMDVLKINNHEIIYYKKEAKNITGALKKIIAFVSGIYNPKAIKEVNSIIQDKKPDIVQIQNIYPQVSIAILKTIKKHNIPIIMRAPNYRIFCPTGLFYNDKNGVCERCAKSKNELWCIYNNCANDIFKSIAYAFRNCYARINKVYHKYVDCIIVQSEFQKNKFISYGIEEKKIIIVHGITPKNHASSDNVQKKYITYVGRGSREKGIDEFYEMARRMPNEQFAFAGEIANGIDTSKTPSNLLNYGYLSGDKLDDLFNNTKILVVPSRCYEGFPNVITRGMIYKIPIVATKIGCLPEIVKNGINGLLYENGNIDQLVLQTKKILQDPAVSIKYGKNGYNDAINKYSCENAYNIIIKKYTELVKKTK